MNENLKYYIAIGQITKVGNITAKKLIACCGGVDAVFRNKKNDFLKIDGINEVLANNIILERDEALKNAEKELVFIEKNHIKTYIYSDKNYPKRLAACDDGPVVFYSMGDVDFDSQKIISVVGTRKATQYGVELCEKIIADLAAKHKPIIVSGLAYGIDVCAHKAALHNNLKTIAVMGTGFDTIYPAQHRNIAKQIMAQGALITEFNSQSKFERENFLKRNRIIAGISDATLVVESGEKGGALVTADIAMSYNRDVLAFPGRIGDEYSKGCNKLIKICKAALIESVADIEYALGWTSENETAKQLPLFDNLDETEMTIVNYLKKVGTDNIDSLSKETQIPMSKLSAILLSLEFAGYIKSLPGKIYALKK